MVTPINLGDFGISGGRALVIRKPFRQWRRLTRPSACHRVMCIRQRLRWICLSGGTTLITFDAHAAAAFADVLEGVADWAGVWLSGE
jgi:hypothetical protein